MFNILALHNIKYPPSIPPYTKGLDTGLKANVSERAAAFTVLTVTVQDWLAHLPYVAYPVASDETILINRSPVCICMQKDHTRTLRIL